jgi:anti-anti-sigma factor
MQLADLHFDQREAALVARLSGEVDSTNTTGLSVVLLEQLPHECPGLVLDLSALAYLDSAGIHMLYSLSNALQARGKQLGLVVPPGSPAEATLRYAAVLSQLRAQPTVEDAVALLRG